MHGCTRVSERAWSEGDGAKLSLSGRFPVAGKECARLGKLPKVGGKLSIVGFERWGLVKRFFVSEGLGGERPGFSASGVVTTRSRSETTCPQKTPEES